MRGCRNFNNLFNHDRKLLYSILSIVMVSVLTLTVIYAALSTTLQINGQAEVSAANWDIHLDNVVLNSSSATTTAPTIIDSKTATFSTTLSKPGDYYMFTIDVVNNGSIDAMIDSVTKTPDLTDIQKKYLNYIVEYQNGELISNKQLVEKNSFVRLKVKVEFRKDISASDLPTTSETLSLSFTVNYVQSDESSQNIIVENNGKILEVVNGDGRHVGDEICIKDECFYVISSTNDSVTMLAKYNLYVGNMCTDSNTSLCTPYGDEATGLQDSTMLAYVLSSTRRNGAAAFSLTNYWGEVSTGTYVYDSNSVAYKYVENYRVYLENLGLLVYDARLVKIEELEAIGCSRITNSCEGAPEWTYVSSYWTGSVRDSSSVYRVISDGNFGTAFYNIDYVIGIRPVVTINF